MCFAKEILKENMFHAISQFQKYAEMGEIDRNNHVIDVLQNILDEAKKYQTEFAEWQNAK